MSMKTLFSQKDWCTLQFSPLWVFHLVAGADGKIDKKEMAALAEIFGKSLLMRNELARELMMTNAMELAKLMPSYMADGRSAEQGLRQVAEILDAKLSPELADGFKKMLMGIGVEIANASGPWFRPKISKEETVALALMASWLRLSLAA